MPLVPDLRVIPLTRIVPHEDFDPLRVDRLARRISESGHQLNPVICIEADSGDFVLLDGATRTAALRHLGLGYGLVQVVAAETVTLATWHHVVRDANPDEVLGRIDDNQDLLVVAPSMPPRLSTSDGRRVTVSGTGSLYRALSAMVDSYVGRWKVSRMEEADLPHVAELYPDWAVLVEHPILTIDDVMKAALSEDRLPAGVTRFIVPDRALRVKAELVVLAEGPQSQRQAQLDQMIEDLVGAARVRRYPQSVVIFDE